jgi:5-methylcytosine-specific restriction protein A
LSLQPSGACSRISIMDLFSVEMDEGAIRKEKDKARRLRQSQWWKRQLDRGCCHYCRNRVPPSELTMDHIVPLVRGGKTKKGNVVPACKECNNKKKYLLPVEWDTYLNSLTENDSQ